jgi:hypothetical protein
MTMITAYRPLGFIGEQVERDEPHL